MEDIKNNGNEVSATVADKESAITERRTRRERIREAVRDKIAYFNKSQFNLNPALLEKLKDQGKEVSYVVYSSMGQDMRENYSKALNDQWRPLKAQDYPELGSANELSPFPSRHEEESLVRVGGQIAMMRDKEIGDAERAIYEEATLGQEEFKESSIVNKQYSPAHGQIQGK
jgi:hypothetical protein